MISTKKLLLTTSALSLLASSQVALGHTGDGVVLVKQTSLQIPNLTRYYGDIEEADSLTEQDAKEMGSIVPSDFIFKSQYITDKVLIDSDVEVKYKGMQNEHMQDQPNENTVDGEKFEIKVTPALGIPFENRAFSLLDVSLITTDGGLNGSSIDSDGLRFVLSEMNRSDQEEHINTIMTWDKDTLGIGDDEEQALLSQMGEWPDAIFKEEDKPSKSTLDILDEALLGAENARTNGKVATDGLLVGLRLAAAEGYRLSNPQAGVVVQSMLDNFKDAVTSIKQERETKEADRLELEQQAASTPVEAPAPVKNLPTGTLKLTEGMINFSDIKAKQQAAEAEAKKAQAEAAARKAAAEEAKDAEYKAQHQNVMKAAAEKAEQKNAEKDRKAQEEAARLEEARKAQEEAVVAAFKAETEQKTNKQIEAADLKIQQAKEELRQSQTQHQSKEEAWQQQDQELRVKQQQAEQNRRIAEDTKLKATESGENANKTREQAKAQILSIETELAIKLAEMKEKAAQELNDLRSKINREQQEAKEKLEAERAAEAEADRKKEEESKKRLEEEARLKEARKASEDAAREAAEKAALKAAEEAAANKAAEEAANKAKANPVPAPVNPVPAAAPNPAPAPVPAPVNPAPVPAPVNPAPAPNPAAAPNPAPAPVPVNPAPAAPANPMVNVTASAINSVAQVSALVETNPTTANPVTQVANPVTASSSVQAPALVLAHASTPAFNPVAVERAVNSTPTVNPHILSAQEIFFREVFNENISNNNQNTALNTNKQAANQVVSNPAIEKETREMVQNVGTKLANNMIGNIAEAANATGQFMNKEIADKVCSSALSDAVVGKMSQQQQAAAFASYVKAISGENKSAESAVKEAIKKDTEDSLMTGDVVYSEITKAVASTVQSRLSTISDTSQNFAQSANSSSGVAAGDESEMRTGAWVSGLMGRSRQGEINGSGGYNGKINGVSAGFDLGVTDTTTIGVAYTKAYAGFKYKSGHGSKTTSDSDIFSVYGLQQLTDKLTLKAIIFAGRSAVTNNTAKYTGNNNYLMATGKFKNTSYSGEVSLSYKLDMQGFSLVPSVGVVYRQFKDTAYTETGSGLRNLFVASKKSSDLTSIIGVKALMPKQLEGGTTITPSINLSLENYLSNKRQKIKAKFFWMNEYFDASAMTTKSAKFAVNLGGGLTVQHKNIEISGSYNYQTKKKYESHQGSLKLRVFF